MCIVLSATDEAFAAYQESLSAFPVFYCDGALKHAVFVMPSGHSFEEIKESEETKFLRARAKAIDDIESMLSSHRRRKIM